MEIFFLVGGLIMLWLGAELIVNGISSFAQYFKVSPFFLGLTLLAIGTDLPETFIVVLGAIEQRLGINTSSLIVGEIVGSSVSQISLILGIIGLLGIVVIKKNKIFRDGAMLVLSVLVLFLMLFDGSIVWYEGIVLLITYILYLFTLLRDEKMYQRKIVLHSEKFSMRWSVVSLIGGFLLLGVASHVTIANALTLSEVWNLPQVFVGSIIIGLGTSLPELITAFHAVRKKVTGLAIGGLIGSNIYDVLVPIGLGSVISPLQVPHRILYFDIPYLFIVSGIVLLFLRKDYTMTLKESIVLILLYVLYFVIQLLWL